MNKYSVIVIILLISPFICCQTTIISEPTDTVEIDPIEYYNCFFISYGAGSAYDINTLLTVFNVSFCPKLDFHINVGSLDRYSITGDLLEQNMVLGTDMELNGFIGYIYRWQSGSNNMFRIQGFAREIHGEYNP